MLFAVDCIRLPPGEVCVRDLHRQVAASLDEDGDVKEDLLRTVNQAVLLMSPRPFAPPMLHYKHVIVRLALVQLCDDIDNAEWQLRRDLRLLDDSRFHRLATFSPSQVSLSHRTPTTGGGMEKRSRLRVSAKKSCMQTGQRKITKGLAGSAESAGSTGSAVEHDAEEENIDWEQPVPSQYREKLRALVYTRLGSALSALLPILAHDGDRINPLLPKPEI